MCRSVEFNAVLCRHLYFICIIILSVTFYITQLDHGDNMRMQVKLKLVLSFAKPINHSINNCTWFQEKCLRY
jgi:hypothetical protein